VEAGRIERDLLAMLDLLEAERDARLASGHEDGGSHELTEEERAAGMALLTDLPSTSGSLRTSRRPGTWGRR